MIGHISPRRPFPPQEVTSYEDPFHPANARPVQREKVSSHTNTLLVRERQARPTRKSVFAHEDPSRPRTPGPSNAKKRRRTRRPISSANARAVQREKVSSHTKTHFVCEREARPTRKSVFAHEDPFRLRTRGPSNAKKCLRTRRPISSANARPVQREKVSSHTKTHFVCKREHRPARKNVFAHEDPFVCEREARPARKNVFAHEGPFRLRTRSVR